MYLYNKENTIQISRYYFAPIRLALIIGNEEATGGSISGHMLCES